MKHRRWRPDRLKRKNTETGLSLSGLLQMKRKAVSRKHIPAVFRSMKARKKKALQDDPKEEETAGSASDQMEEAAKDGYEEVSENQEAVAGEDAETEETASEEYEENEGDEAVSEEALQEDGSLQKDDSAYEEVEETAAPYGTEAASAADPSLSEDDEWLYSKPRRFAKKPANEQKN